MILFHAAIDKRVCVLQQQRQSHEYIYGILKVEIKIKLPLW